MPSEEQRPLLQDGGLDREGTRADNHDSIDLPDGKDGSYVSMTRRRAQQFLGSKLGHYSVLLLVSVDVACIFADFLINIYLCEHECCNYKSEYRALHETLDALGIISLVFSCLFMVELAASIWAFGLS